MGMVVIIGWSGRVDVEENRHTVGSLNVCFNFNAFISQHFLTSNQFICIKME